MAFPTTDHWLCGDNLMARRDIPGLEYDARAGDVVFGPPQRLSAAIERLGGACAGSGSASRSLREMGE